MTPNEVRKKIGLEGDIEGGDMPGIGYEPAVSRVVSNEEREEAERQINLFESERGNRNGANGQRARKSEGNINFQPPDTV